LASVVLVVVTATVVVVVETDVVVVVEEVVVWPNAPPGTTAVPSTTPAYTALRSRRMPRLCSRAEV
jgi:hypothetical protein